MKNLYAVFFLVFCIQVNTLATDSSAIYYQRGLEEKTAKRWLVASTWFEKAISQNPKYLPAYLENAYTNLEMRKTDAAMRNFAMVLEMEPENPLALKEMMELYFNYHQYKKAIETAQKCKNCINSNKVMALSYYKLEDYTNAERLLLKLVKQFPTDAEICYTLGRTYMEMELEARAIPFFSKAVELDNTRKQWFYELGILYYNSNNFKNAVIVFNKAADLGFTQSMDFKENLGYAYLYSGDTENGEKILLNILDKRRGSRDIMRDLALTYYDLKNYDKCLEFCQKLMELDMKDAKALYQAGLCFIMKGQKDRGQQMCDKAIEMDPSLNALRQKKMNVGL